MPSSYPTPNTSTNTKTNKPGSKRPKKISEYGKQLQEKQKTRNSYGLREAQFKRYFDAAAKFKGQTGEMLLQILERRLDNVVFRAGFTRSRAQARQLVNHRHMTLNGNRVGIPSISVKVDDVIVFHKEHEVSIAPETPKVDWLKVDPKKGKITVERIPTGIDLPVEFDTQRVVEFYSK